MDALGKLAELHTQVSGARRVAGRTVLDPGALLAGLAQARHLVAAELQEASALARERAELVEAGRRETEQLRAELAQARRTPVPVGDPAAESEQMRAEATDFADRSLAELEAVLQRVLFTISRARTALDRDGSVLGAHELRQSLQPADLGRSDGPDPDTEQLR